MAKEEQVKLLNLAQRWVILLPKEEMDNFEETDFKVIMKQKSAYDGEYYFALIESVLQDGDYRPDDILCLTGAMAVHEEWSNAIIIQADELEDIYNDIYPWEGSGNVFMGDMLTDMEKLNYLLQYLYIEHKELVEVKDIQVRKEKESPLMPLEENEELLFGDQLYGVRYKDDEVVFWWPILLEESGLYIVILDETKIDEDDEEDTETAKYLNYPWGSYDDYDYGDDYYKRL